MRIYLDRNLFRVDERTILSGSTALIFASRRPRNYRMMRLLLEYGADPWVENKSGQSCIATREYVSLFLSSS